MQKFTTRVRARYCETDAAGVIYYGSFMHYFEVGKMEMYRDLVLPFEKKTFPCESTERPRGFTVASVAGIPSPADPHVPVPATVEMNPVEASILRMRQ